MTHKNMSCTFSVERKRPWTKCLRHKMFEGLKRIRGKIVVFRNRVFGDLYLQNSLNLKKKQSKYFYLV